MFSTGETQDIDRYLGKLVEKLPGELDTTERQALKEEAARLRAWTQREIPSSQSKTPSARRQMVYNAIAGIFCFVMAGVFYCELTPPGERNTMIILPMFLVLWAGQAMGRSQQLR